MKRSSPRSSSIAPGDLDGLQEVCLVDETLDVESQRCGRPACFRSLFHEASFIVFCAFVAASFATLQHGTLMMMETIRADINGDVPAMVWMLAAPA